MKFHEISLQFIQGFSNVEISKHYFNPTKREPFLLSRVIEYHTHVPREPSTSINKHHIVQLPAQREQHNTKQQNKNESTLQNVEKRKRTHRNYNRTLDGRTPG